MEESDSDYEDHITVYKEKAAQLLEQKDAATPAGSPSTAKKTLPKPLRRVGWW